MCTFSMQRSVRWANDHDACTISCYSHGIDGRLKIRVRDAWDLEDTDSFLAGKSDPYVRITAVKYSTLVRVTRQTSTKKGKLDATWNEELNFGCGHWKHIDVSVWDSDSGADDLLMPIETYPICNYGECSITYMHGETTLNFDLSLVADGNDCQPNPCLNGASCVDGCGATCVCRPRYYGSICQNYRSPYHHRHGHRD